MTRKHSSWSEDNTAALDRGASTGPLGRRHGQAVPARGKRPGRSKAPWPQCPAVNYPSQQVSTIDNRKGIMLSVVASA
jgi:hypothetical protein